jgi:broad specificity phosphatase PhoE
MKSVFLRIVVCLLLVSAWASAQQNRTIFLVRHAERASSAPDTPLSPAGVKRAECLARTLKDAGIKKIFVTNTKRAQQTAEPLATSLGVTPTVLPASDISGLVRNLFYGSDNALVVGHSDTLPLIIQRLQAGTVPAIKDDEYDRLFVVSMLESSAAPVASLRYCDCGGATAAAPMMKPPSKKSAPPKP